MSVRVEVICVNADGGEQRREVLAIEPRELAMETLGLNLKEGKALLAGVQDLVVAQQVHDDLERRRRCPHCRQRYTSKESGSTPVSTVFGRSRCRIRDGSAAPVSARAPRRSIRPGLG